MARHTCHRTYTNTDRRTENAVKISPDTQWEAQDTTPVTRSDTSNHTPSTSHQIPNSRHKTTVTRHESPCTKHQSIEKSPIIRHQAPFTSHQTPNASHQTSVTRHQKPKLVIRHQAPEIKHIETRIYSAVTKP